MFEDYYMTADDVAKALKISKSFAYKVIRKMNAELQEQGFFTMAGKVNKQFFLDKTCYDAGVKRIRIHDLRHSHISLLIEMGYSAVAIADRVGHESINITYNYAHLFPSTQTDMADKLNNFRKEPTQNVS